VNLVRQIQQGASVPSEPTPIDAFALALRQGIKAERGRRSISQAEFARRMGWVRQTATAVEQGTRVVYASELPMICEALGCTLSRLLVDAPAADRRRLGLD
jgi:transcriptional regulator with XRE-family HTH domain